jgi:hypothetical protein
MHEKKRKCGIEKKIFGSRWKKEKRFNLSDNKLFFSNDTRLDAPQSQHGRETSS